MLPHELLNQAGFLAAPDGREPSDADLRRGVSACYYAVFHALVADATEQVASNGTVALKSNVRRMISHAHLTRTCEIFSRPIGKIPDPLRSALTGTLEPELVFLARTFPELQQARHQADYDDQAAFDLSELTYWLTRAYHAYDGWRAIRHTPNAAAFLTMILLGDKFGRRG